MVKYWVASHITGFFTIHDDHADPLYRGSRGAGFSISRGTTTEIEYSDDKKIHFFFNSEEVTADIANVSNHVLSQYLNHIKSKTEIDFGISIYHEFDVPLSSVIAQFAAATVASRQFTASTAVGSTTPNFSD